MPLHNADIATYFEEMADALEIQGANRFRIRSYRDAARTISSHSRNLTDMIEKGEDLTELPDIGDNIADKIHTIVETERLPQLEELFEEMPRGLLDVLKVEGVGPKTTKKLYDELGVSSLDDLEAAGESGDIQSLKGLGPKTEEKILDNIPQVREGDDRTRLADAEKRAEPYLEYLRAVEGTERVRTAGSYRRRKETVGDLDILVTCEDHEPVMDAFVNYDDVQEVIQRGDTKSSVRIRPGLQVDLRVVDADQYGAALHYFTGSKAHNIECRKRSIDRDLKLNEYGLFDEDDNRVAGETEKEIYDTLDLPFIEPELRESRGEVAAAEDGSLPDLVEVDDLKGELHCHTKASDGSNTIREMAEEARSIGHEYIAITDHSKSSRVANGLDEDRLLEQIDRVDAVNDDVDGIEVLKSSEVDILKDGSLDFDDDILARLDLVVCSIHSNFNLSEEKQTNRVLRAMENPHFDILGHATGRRIGEREPYDINMERVLEAAAENGCFVELNAQPARLDLSDVHCQMAKEMGVLVPITTDAHQTGHLHAAKYGVYQARRGWLEADDVLNTRSLDELEDLLER